MTRDEFRIDTTEIVMAALVAAEAPHVLNAASRDATVLNAARVAVQAADCLWDVLRTRSTKWPESAPLRATLAIRCMASLLAYWESIINHSGKNRTDMLNQSAISAVIAADAAVAELNTNRL